MRLNAVAVTRNSRPIAALLPLIMILCLVLALDQLLLWMFLGMLPIWSAPPVIIVFVLITLGMLRQSLRDRATWCDGRVVSVCAAVSAVIFLLGGEGRLFYAHPDWQVRAAVLRDLTLYPWPFVYDVRSEPDLLRAPIGMYLLPAMIGKALGYHAAEWALFVQNAALLTVLLTLGSRLFDSARERCIALGIFLAFSGMDLVGQLALGQPPQLSAERWNVAVFSAHLTQLFTVPQHALAGWIGALLFLLWRDGKLALVGFLAPIPLLALWSPLGVIGIVPFAALAGIEALRGRSLRAYDVVVPVITSVFAIPSLLYLASASAAVGGGAATITLSQYVTFEMIEVIPYLSALVFLDRNRRFGGTTLAVTTIVLLVLPFVRVGTSGDLVMRASIPALAILAVSAADILVHPSNADNKLWPAVIITALTIGLVTPVFEIVRALAYPRSPAMHCSYFGVVPGGFDTYVAPLSRIHPLIAPNNPTKIRPDDPVRCWSTKWPNPLYHDFPERVAPQDRDERL